MISPQTFNLFLFVMAVIAVVVFVALFFVDAGYGKFYTPKWGPTLDNHLGWFLMEVPVFLAMLLLWWFSDRRTDGVRMVFLVLSSCTISTAPSSSRGSCGDIAGCLGPSC